MTIKQLSIFIENKAGTLIKVLDLLSKEGIQIIASTIADTQEFGIYRIICAEPLKAYNILRAANINVQLTDVLAVQIDDKPGAAANVIDIFAKGGVNVAYMYSFLLKGKGVLILRTFPADKANELMILNKVNFVTEEDLK
ncbi:MAG: amino acid-binding protein [Bacteroidales bacterium]|nr:amino acid-binding protein [Bacteroidales bacterium]